MDFEGIIIRVFTTFEDLVKMFLFRNTDLILANCLTNVLAILYIGVKIK